MKAYLFIFTILAILAIGCATPVDNTEALNTLGTKVDTLTGVVDDNSKSQQELESKIETLTKTIEELKDSVAPTPDPKAPDVKDVFADVFKNASKVEVIDREAFGQCQVYSTYDIEFGDVLEVEVMLVRKEDERSGHMVWKPNLLLLSRLESQPVRQEITLFRTVDNPWNKMSEPYQMVLYRGKYIYERKNGNRNIGHGNILTAGTYGVEFFRTGNYPVDLHRAEPTNRIHGDGTVSVLEEYPTGPTLKSDYCDKHLKEMGLHTEDIVEGTFLVAWYVK